MASFTIGTLQDRLSETESEPGRFGDPSVGSNRRALLFAGIVAVHIALLVFLARQHAEIGVGQAVGTAQGLLIFDVGGLDVAQLAKPVAPPVPTAAAVAVAAVQNQAPPMEMVSAVVASSPPGPASPQAAGRSDDPFAAAALPIMAMSEAGPPVVRSTLQGLDQAALTAILVAFRNAHPSALGFVILRCAVGGDGSIAQATVLTGALDQRLAAALTDAIERQRLFPPAGEGARTAFIGPFAIEIAGKAAA